MLFSELHVGAVYSDNWEHHKEGRGGREWEKEKQEEKWRLWMKN